MALVQVTPDLVISELIKDQLDNNKQVTPAAMVSATMVQENVRHAISVLTQLGFVIAREEQ